MSSVDDLYDPDYPHGTPAGYDRGCRGAACLNHGSAEFLTCREAKEAAGGNWAYRNQPRDEPFPRTVDGPPAKQRDPIPAGGVGTSGIMAPLGQHKPSPPVTAPPSPVPVPVAMPAEEPLDEPGKRRPFTGADGLRMRELHKQGLSDGAIARELGRAQAMISKRLRNAGLAPNGKTPTATTVEPDSSTGPVPDPVTQPLEQPAAGELVTPPAAGTPDHGPVLDVRACRVCGCTDDDCSGCIERTGSACSWVEWDLCSACDEPTEPEVEEASATPSEAPSSATADPNVIADLERRLQEAGEDLHRAQEANGTLVDQLAATDAELRLQRERADVSSAALAVADDLAPASTGGDTPTALAEVTATASVDQLELIVAHTEQGTRLQLAVPAGATAELQIIGGSVSMKVAGR